LIKRKLNFFNNANKELKNTNSYNENAIASDLNGVIFFLKIINIELKNQHHMLFFVKLSQLPKK
jgi:hypothetical protein